MLLFYNLSLLFLLVKSNIKEFKKNCVFLAAV